MTDLVTFTQDPPQIVDYQSRAVQRLGEWAHSADAAYHVAERLVQTSFVPQQFRGKPVEATAAILAGSEVGLSPMASLRAFDIIQGQAAPRAITLRAVVQSYGHQIVLVESTATRCRMKGLRRGSAEWQTVTWTIDRARDLGLVGKDNWKKQPGAMLVARATGELARLIAADAILGIGYTAEEVADGGAAEPLSTDDAPAPTRRVLSRTAPRAVEPQQPEPADVSGLPEEQGEAPAADGITQPQQRKMGALMREHGLTERDAALAYVAAILGRPVESRSELTKVEAGKVIDALEAEAPAQWSGDDPTPAS